MKRIPWQGRPPPRDEAARDVPLPGEGDGDRAVGGGAAAPRPVEADPSGDGAAAADQRLRPTHHRSHLQHHRLGGQGHTHGEVSAKLSIINRETSLIHFYFQAAEKVDLAYCRQFGHDGGA